jgi:hypothetical protein
MDIEKIDFSKIFLSTDRKGYRFSYDRKSFKIEIPDCEIPFGIELYNKKEILNINLYDNEVDTNKKINTLNYLKLLEKIYEQFSNKKIESKNLPFVSLPFGFTKEVENKEFLTTIKPGHKGGVFVRTHLAKSIKVYKLEDGKKVECVRPDLKGKKCSLILELNSMWMYGGKYGFLWYVHEIILKN